MRARVFTQVNTGIRAMCVAEASTPLSKHNPASVFESKLIGNLSPSHQVVHTLPSDPLKPGFLPLLSLGSSVQFPSLEGSCLTFSCFWPSLEHRDSSPAFMRDCVFSWVHSTASFPVGQSPQRAAAHHTAHNTSWYSDDLRSSEACFMRAQETACHLVDTWWL